MSKRRKQQARELLKSVNLRRTRPRVRILAALLGGRRPQTADEISAKLAAPAPNRVTIYRVLESLLKAGLVHKAFLDERTWHFEPAHNCTERQCHPHFTCTDCGDTHCLMDVSLPMAESPHKGFIIDRQRVQLEGLCPKCSVGTA